MEENFLFCKGTDKRDGKKFVCPHVEFCLRYSTRKESLYHRYGKTVPVDADCGCKYFKLIPEKSVEKRVAAETKRGKK